MLLCLVNDVLDIKLIEQGQFVPKIGSFAPQETFEFIMDMFKPQAEMQNTDIQFETVSCTSLDQAFRHGHDPRQMPSQPLPEKLMGDNLRLK